MKAPRGKWFALLAVAGFCPVAFGQPNLQGVDPPGYQIAEEVDISLRGQGLQNLNGVLFLTEGMELVEFLEPGEGEPGRTAVARVRLSDEVEPGIHWLRVRSPHGISNMQPFALGDFPVVPPGEDNEAPEGAHRIALNHTVGGQLARGRSNYFVVSLENGQRISLEVEGIRLAGPNVPRGSMFNPSITILSGGEDGFEELAFSANSHLFRQDPYLVFEAPGPGDYLIEVRDVTFRGPPTAGYRLHIGDYVRPATTLPLGAPAGEPTLFRFIENDGTAHEQLATLRDSETGFTGVFFEREGRRPQAGNRVRVSPHENVIADGGNTSRGQALPVEAAVPMALNGVLAEPGDEAWFQLTLEKGGTLSMTVFAHALGSPLDSILSIHDAEGRQLVNNDDAPPGNPDSALDFEVPDDGTYFVRIRDHLERGGPTFAYRIEINVQGGGVVLSNPQFNVNDTHYRQFLTIPRDGVGMILMTLSRSRFADEVEFVLPDLPEGLEIISDPVPRGLNSFPLIVRATGDVPLQGWYSKVDAKAVSEESPEFSTSYRQSFSLVISGPGQTVHHSVDAHRMAVAVTDPPPFQVRMVQPSVPLLRNGMVNLAVQIERDEGYTAPMRLFLPWLPNGVSTLQEVNVPEGETSAAFELSANENAAVGDWQLALLAEAAAEVGNHYAAAEPVRLNVEEAYLSATAEMTVTQQGGEGEVVLTLERHREHEGEITFQVMNGPNGVVFESPVMENGATELLIPFQVGEEAPVGRFGNLLVRAEIAGDAGVMTQQVLRDLVLRIDRPRPEAANAGQGSGQRLSRLEQLRLEAGGE